MYLGFGCLIVLQVLLISSTLAQTTAQQIIDEAFKAVSNAKSNFENIKLKRERDYRNQLKDTLNSNSGELFRSLDDELFKPEELKVNALVDSLSGTQEQSCVSTLKDNIYQIKARDSRYEYQFYFNTIEAEARQVSQKLNEGQDNVNNLAYQAEQKIKQCQQAYKVVLNITALETCVVDAQAQLKLVSADLDASLEKLTRKQFVTNLAIGVDKTVTFVSVSLNANYDAIQKCFSKFKSKLATRMANLIPLYKSNVTANAVNDVTKALASLTAAPAGLLEALTNTKAKVEETLKKRNINQDTIKVALLNNENVVKYQNALLKASQDLAIYSQAKGCLEDAQNKFKDNINSKSGEIKRCLDATSSSISVGDVNNLENPLLERIRYEGEVAVVACLTSSGTVATNNTVVCSEQADLAFQIYVASVKIKQEEISNKADSILSQINNCEQTATPILTTTQIYNKQYLENCLLEKASIEYTLKIQ